MIIRNRNVTHLFYSKPKTEIYHPPMYYVDIYVFAVNETERFPYIFMSMYVYVYMNVITLKSILKVFNDV